MMMMVKMKMMHKHKLILIVVFVQGQVQKNKCPLLNQDMCRSVCVYCKLVDWLHPAVDHLLLLRAIP